VNRREAAQGLASDLLSGTGRRLRAVILAKVLNKMVQIITYFGEKH